MPLTPPLPGDYRRLVGGAITQKDAGAHAQQSTRQRPQQQGAGSIARAKAGADACRSHAYNRLLPRLPLQEAGTFRVRVVQAPLECPRGLARPATPTSHYPTCSLTQSGTVLPPVTSVFCPMMSARKTELAAIQQGTA